MRLWLLSLVAGIALGVAGTPLGKVSMGREQIEEKKEVQDKPKKMKRQIFITGAYTGLSAPGLNISEFITVSSKPMMYHLDSSKKGKEEKGQIETDPYKKPLSLPRTILLQLLNLTEPMNRSSEMDFINWNLNASIIRDLCDGCCEGSKEEKPNLRRQPRELPKLPRKRKPGRWTIRGRPALPPENSSINVVMMMFHNDTHSGSQAKEVTQQTEDLRGEWCSVCCEEDETLQALERREGEEVREVSPA
ncbi:uncharacterized protein LOC127538193 isoform X1 [Antechinus flavipes]|uniref:uncharacterized protein LOC127538193 isoform X1 n=1 Tax=Antechinus flavipes TaxID=38775 RepID=UPI0022356B25|nr:uncharacterized protein LOC127538193 isoform X1 [Antechinus flavipes]XP_051817779.1 uncharacterized protein LOC127538193 isoform X1 [Antechinus flavipes]